MLSMTNTHFGTDRAFQNGKRFRSLNYAGPVKFLRASPEMQTAVAEQDVPSVAANCARLGVEFLKTRLKLRGDSPFCLGPFFWTKHASCFCWPGMAE